MSIQIPIAFVDDFKAAIISLSQQKQPKLRRCCRMEPITGDTMFVERIGPKDAVLHGARHGATPISDAPHTRRKLSVADYDVPADLIDKADKLKMIIDPQSTYVQNQVFSLNRAIDDVIITALGGPAYGGHTGATTINNYDVDECRLIGSDGTIKAAGSNHTLLTATGLTIAKMLTAKDLLDNAEIDPDRERFWVCNPHTINNFMNLTEVKSSDYNTSKVLAAGRIDSFCGFTFIPSTRLPADGTDVDATNCYAFASGAIVLAVAQEPSVDVSVRNDLCNSVQVYSTLSIGATRVEGPAVIEINLDTI